MNHQRFGMNAFLVVLLAILQEPGSAYSADIIAFSENERAFIESHGPWPPEPQRDPSNRVSGNTAAIEFGRHLFFDTAVSGDGAMSCATCHDPDTGFSDARDTGFGRHLLPRNTLGLYNLRGNRWFGWDGGADSLWAQSLRPILAANEMNASAETLRAAIAQDTDLDCLYRKTFGTAPLETDPQDVLVDAAKALAAFQETLTSARTPFDTFRDAMLSGDHQQAERYPASAQRGLKIFVGKGQCSLCHFGPLFSNGEFADVGIPFFMGKGKVDKGRYGGIQKLKSSPYTLAGAYNDDEQRNHMAQTARVVLLHRNWGEFKVPSLRNVALTAPYMHNGTLATLADVINHYSEIDEERLHIDGMRILKPLKLTPRESDDLEAFLRSLSAPLHTPQTGRPTPPACAG